MKLSLEELDELNKPTESQLDFISLIEWHAQEDFCGTTREEASDYIRRNKSCLPRRRRLFGERRFRKDCYDDIFNVPSDDYPESYDDYDEHISAICCSDDMSNGW